MFRNTGDIHEKPWSATVFLTVQWKELNVNAQMSNTMGTTSWITRKGLLRSLAKLTSRHERDITLTFKLDGSELVAHGGAISGEVSLKELELELKHKRDAKVTRLFLFNEMVDSEGPEEQCPYQVGLIRDACRVDEQGHPHRPL